MSERKCDYDEMYNLRFNRCEPVALPVADNVYRILMGSQYYVGDVYSINELIAQKFSEKHDVECKATGEMLEMKESTNLSVLQENLGMSLVSFMDEGFDEILCEVKDVLLDYWRDEPQTGYQVPATVPNERAEEYSTGTFVNFPIWSDKYISKRQADLVRHSLHYIFVIVPTQYHFVSEDLESRGTIYYLVPVGYLRGEALGERSEIRGLSKVKTLELESAINSVTFNASFEYLAIGSNDEVAVWEIDSWEKRHSRVRQRVNQVVFHPSENNLLASRQRYDIKLWNSNDLSNSFTQDLHQLITDLAFSESMLLVIKDGNLEAYNIDDLIEGTMMMVGSSQGALANMFTKLSICEDPIMGTEIVVAVYAGQVGVWDIGVLGEPRNLFGDSIENVVCRKGVVVTSAPNVISLWDLRRGQSLGLDYFTPGNIQALELTNDFVIAIIDGSIVVLKLEDMTLLHQFASPSGLPFTSVSYNPIYQLLATSAGNNAYIYELYLR